MALFSQRSIDNLVGIHPVLVKVMKIAICGTPVDFTITDGVRTTEQQQKLYAQGRTVPGAIVTNCDGVTRKSNHQAKEDGYGYAVDIYPFVNGKVQVNDAKNLSVIADHIIKVASANGINIQWGGNWKMKDYPHFELVI